MELFAFSSSFQQDKRQIASSFVSILLFFSIGVDGSNDKWLTDGVEKERERFLLLRRYSVGRSSRESIIVWVTVCHRRDFVATAQITRDHLLRATCCAPTYSLRIRLSLASSSPGLSLFLSPAKTQEEDRGPLAACARADGRGLADSSGHYSNDTIS